MKALACALALLTRIPVPASADPETAGKAVRWFPAVGALIGFLYLTVAYLAALVLPATVAAVLVVVTEALITGALHMDGLADTADGFGGGKDRDDTLRIMRDHAVGSYGAAALALLIVLKVTAIAALIERHQAFPYLLLAPVLGRWTVAPLARLLPYARPENAVSSYVGNMELISATFVAAAIAIAAAGTRGADCWAAVTAATGGFGWFSHSKIGGVTGDTLGAAVEIGECVVLLTALLR